MEWRNSGLAELQDYIQTHNDGISKNAECFFVESKRLKKWNGIKIRKLFIINRLN